MDNAARRDVSRGGVVGRDAELERIEAFARALPRGCRALTVRGEPGIGKTAVWARGVERCREAGCRILVTRPAEEEMALDLVSSIDLFEGVGLDVAALRAEEDPFTRGRAVLDALRRQAEREPVVVAIDDLQWLDPVSARALRYALRRLEAEPVGVLATLRTGEGREDPLVSAATLPADRVETIDLGPLGIDDLRRVLGATVTAISRPTLRRIHEVSGGNPLYAIELARGLAADERVGRSSTILSPGSIAAAITRSLEAAPADLAPMLEVVAGLGRVPVLELERLLPAEDVDRLLDVAVREGILSVDGRLVRFSHPLIGEAVYGRMTPLARHSLHARLADHAVDPDLRARHLALSTDEARPEVAALLEVAAERASGRGAFDLAAEFARHSLRLTPAADAELALRRAQAEIENLAAAGEAHRALDLADRLVATTPPGRGRAEALVLRFDLENKGHAHRGIAFLRHALDDAGDDRLLRARVLDELAFGYWLTHGAVREAIECAREAMAIAKVVDDDRLTAITLAGLAHLEAIGGSPRPDDMRRVIALEDRTGRLPLTTGRRGRVLLAKQERWAGNLREARDLIAAGSHTNEFQRPFMLYDLALLECAAGDFAAAEEFLDRGLEAVRDSGSSLGDRWFLYPLALIQAWLGRRAEARATAGVLLEDAESRGYVLDVLGARRVLGLLDLSAGDAASAARDLSVAAELARELGIGHPGLYPVLPDAVEALALVGDLESADELTARLERQTSAIGGEWGRAAVDRCRGILLLSRGEAVGAIPLLRRAAQRFERLGHRPEAARAMLWRGRALLRDGKRSLATEVLTDAGARFAAMGAPLWEARAAEELDRAAAGRGTGRLTPTEARIARLVAEGGKNREIAAALFVSVATVEAHLTRIYRKLEIGSRSELARVVTEGAPETS